MDPDRRRLRVWVTDGRGRPIRAAALARWLAGVAPARVRGEVTLALVTDEHIQQLNRQFRRKNAPTDVLSFPQSERRSPSPERRAPSPDAYLGDIAIATGVARRQAREAGHSYDNELRVLALHGLLHLLGYDHHAAADRGRMVRLEARLRRKGGLREGLIERGQATGRVQVNGAKRLRPARADGAKRRAAAPASARERGWGPASTKR